MIGGRFQSGQSGNPGGRPKLLGPVRDLARTHTEKAIETLVKIMQSAKSPAAARVRAAEALLDRGWGKTETKAEVGAPGSFDHLSDEELDDRLVQNFVARGTTEAAARALLRGPELDQKSHIERSTVVLPYRRRC